MSPRRGRIRTNDPTERPDVRRIPCIFPADQGFRPKRRVRRGLPSPPSSLRVHRLPARTAALPENSRRFRGVLAVGPKRSRPETAASGRERGRGPSSSLLASWVVRFKNLRGMRWGWKRIPRRLPPSPSSRRRRCRMSSCPSRQRALRGRRTRLWPRRRIRQAGPRKAAQRNAVTGLVL